MSKWFNNFKLRYCANCGSKISFLSGRSIYCSRLCYQKAAWQKQKAKRAKKKLPIDKVGQRV